jgi:acetyl esterase/lipase
LNFHGGWILDDRDTRDRLVREITAGVKAAVVIFDCARGLESRYPVAIERACVAICYARDRTDLRIDAGHLPPPEFTQFYQA